jgi:hypothetical protein
VTITTQMVERLAQETVWWTFPEIADHFMMSHEFVRRGLKGRLGVRKDGRGYKVPDSVLKAWLTELLQANLNAA